MKNLKSKLVGVAIACAVTPAVYAKYMGHDNPYVGIEFIQTYQTYRNGGGKNIFKKYPQDYNVFAGVNLWRCTGVEMGYEFQPNKNRNAYLIPGQEIMNGTMLYPGQFSDYESSIQAHNPYVGLFADYTAHIRELTTIKFQALIGASVSYVKARNAVLSSESGNTQLSYEQSICTYSKTRLVPMVKLIATLKATNHIGIRLSANYRNMGSFTVQAQESANSTSVLRFKDTYAAGVGLIYSFSKI